MTYGKHKKSQDLTWKTRLEWRASTSILAGKTTATTFFLYKTKAYKCYLNLRERSLV